MNLYRKKRILRADFIGRGGAWLDTGSINDFYNTSLFVSALENRQGLKIACLEEIAFRNGWISKEQLAKSGELLKNTNYGKYILKLIL